MTPDIFEMTMKEIVRLMHTDCKLAESGEMSEAEGRLRAKFWYEVATSFSHRGFIFKDVAAFIRRGVNAKVPIQRYQWPPED